MTGSGPPPLQLSDVTVQFGGLVAVDSVSLEVRDGELFGLIGPNGAGKTTVLNAVAGAVKPMPGKIIFESEDITNVRLAQRVHLGIARSFQAVELFPELTVVENLMLGRHHLMKAGVLSSGLFYGRAKREEIANRKEVEEVIDLFELYPYRFAKAGSLPYGVQKLVGVARALCAEPRLILLDEPASGLNREEREDLARFMLRVKHEREISMVWVEHDVAMVRDLADRVAALHYGRKIAEGPPADVLSLAVVQESFLGGKTGAEVALKQE